MGRRGSLRVRGRCASAGGLAVKDLEQDVGSLYQVLGLRGLQSIRDVGPELARAIEGWLKQWAESKGPRAPVDQGLLL